MITISASEAKTHFGALMDKAQKEPVTIEKQGRPVAVVISFDDYQQHLGKPSPSEKKQALAFLSTWADRPPVAVSETSLEDDPRAQAIWEKYDHK